MSQNNGSYFFPKTQKSAPRTQNEVLKIKNIIDCTVIWEYFKGTKRSIQENQVPYYHKIYDFRKISAPL